ncbi:MAG TPA: helix-turn-helix transcriptional regulator [Nitrosomonas sp.]|nr:helix-turn-helix transcriptional regulator [Nitrosomonas sp.]
MNITHILQETVNKANAADQEDLLKFVNDKSSEFEAAEDEAAIEMILNAAVSDNLITADWKSILLSAVKEFWAMDSRNSIKAEIPIDKIDKSEIVDTPEQNKKETAPAAKPDPVNTGRVYGGGAGAAIMNAGPITLITTGGLLWLLALYLGATWLAVGSLSSIQFRDDIENNYKTTLNNILDLKNLKAEDMQFRSSMQVVVSDWEIELRKVAEKNAIKFEDFIDNNGYRMVCKDEQQKENIKICDQLLEAVAKYNSYRYNQSDKKDKFDKAFEKINQAQDKTTSRNKADDLLARIEFMLKFQFWDMLAMPEQVLTLLLAIAMGVLGSTITMTWTFLRENTNLHLRWYLLRPFVGALSALVIFIFAKAGQMTLVADASNVTLNPFMLSLLGIASGLLSDRAYSQMSLVSGKFLGNMGSEQERWSSHLKEELEKKGITSEALAIALNLDKQRIDEIVTGARMASLVEQQRISDRLGIAQRLLFTDIPP